MANKPKDHTRAIESIKSTINDLKKQVGSVSKDQGKMLSAKAKETSPQDHQAALDHFSSQYKMAKMNGQEDKAKEYAKSYHDYASKLDKHYHAKLNEIGDPEEMYKKTAATSKAKLQAMKAMDKTRQYELERKYSKPEPRKEEVEQIKEAKKFGYDAINARLKKKTGKSLEDRIKHYEEISARLKKQQDEYEAGNKKQNEALDWGSMSKSEFKRRELEHELRHEKEPSYSYRTRRYKADKVYKPYLEPEEPHHVMIGGKKWKTFDTKSHAENVAKKIKGASVEKAS